MLKANCEKQNFLNELSNLHIGEWQLKFEYGDGSKKEFYGSNAYPYNFKELTALLSD